MAYADQEGMSTNRLVSIIIVVLLHVFLGYALVTGLAFEAVKKAAQKMNVIDVKEEEPPKEDEPPPPPPEQKPITSPPPLASKSPLPSPANNLPPPPPMPEYFPPTPPAPKGPPPPPPPPVAKRPKPLPKGNPGNWATTNDYPSRALSQEREGVTRFTVTVGPNGKVTACSVTGSSGHADLDAATCSNVSRRARFDPALDAEGQPTTGSYSNQIRWQIPK